MSAQTPCFRGSAAIKEWFVSALYKFKGVQEPPRSFGETDQYAQIQSVYDFIMTSWERDGQLQRSPRFK
jgi:hypothetical protein